MSYLLLFGWLGWVCKRNGDEQFPGIEKLRQQRLGHADGSPITESIYTHVISEDGKRVAAQLAMPYGEFWTQNGPRKVA